MKKIILTICLILVICSCRDAYHRNLSEYSYKTPRQHEVLKIMRAYFINLYENSSSLSTKKLRELRRMKKNYYYKLSDQDLTLTVPGPSWEIRGPLTIEQVEQESLEEMSQYPDVPQVPFGYANEKWIELKSQYKDGDEFYYFKSDRLSWAYLRGRSGNVLIHNNEVVNMLVTEIN